MREILRDLLTFTAGATVAAILLLAGLATQPDPATVLRGPVSSLEGLAGFAASAAGLALAAWWALGLLLAVLSAGLQKAGHAAAAAAAGALAPAFMKRLATAALGLNLLAGVAAPANAAAPPTPASQQSLSQPSGSQLLPLMQDGSGEAGKAADAPASPHWKPRQPPTGANMLIRPGREEAPPAGAQAIVRPGDTLWSLAAEQLGPHATDARIADHWPRWYELNRAVIGDRPDLIFPGQVLDVPEISPP
ncbi:LysM peptidoglycan-binding domain-containing protein [Arthrobacter jiangjiafuii]|uniref:LysM peptidoglycan-binding domain-containing protein n=1 Tax=Arthrobacter jiangjiafuii TaxID=2817475 RepID=A0A975M3I5_9MICC|nr:LysM peptidoglycan-binding domain-containing protein [Arthrobacter jiangjiafuii]MBP3044602.1 LysM peptidoglycan-binding domain-containing protein [Arthrobacter jiangjiafuii]QWC09298.1 LysM peptidoglycan-binding domain-containing protein [Arthrobacter jiangjiafuii]